MFIDTHAHLNDEKLLSDVQEVIFRAKEFNVERIVNAGYDLASSQKGIELADKYKEVYACIGVHPENASSFDNAVENFIMENGEREKVVAIGEIGLDYHYEGYDKELQKKVFIRQLELADELNLPVVIHSRDATGDMLEILKNNKKLLKHGGLMHCFNGSLQTLKEVLSLRLKVSFGGAITFKNSKNAPMLISNIPLDCFTLETDCPYLCPEPFRGKINEPKNIPLIAQKIADILNINVSEIEEISTENAKNLFKKLK